MTYADSWSDLVSTALVGTSRRPLPPAADHAETPSGDPAARLLERAALAAIQRRAGQRPSPPPAPPPAPAPEETAPYLDGPALKRLNTILDTRRVFLAEWLHYAAATGKLLPPEYLPDVLSHAKGNTIAARALTRVGGARARWLARHCSVWSYLLDFEEAHPDFFDPELWATGTATQRRIQLERLRRTDPEHARDLVARTWANERAETRYELLKAWEHGLSRDDEPLLLTALRDRSHPVRVLAAALLIQLPDSDDGQRLTHHATHLLRTTGAQEQETITLTPPGDVDAEFASLLSPNRRTTKTPEERAHTLLSHLPLRLWIGRLGSSPADVVSKKMDDTVRDALIAAAVRYRDLDWVRAFLDDVGRHTFASNNWFEQLDALLHQLPAEERCDRVAHWLDDPDIPETQTWNLLYRLEFPWVGRLNDILVEQLFTSPDAPDHFGVIAPGAENKLDPGLYERLAPLAEKRKGSREFRHLVTTLEYRYTMREELM